MTAKGLEDIFPQRKYHGINTQSICQLKSVDVTFNVDIGVYIGTGNACCKK